MTSPSRGSKSPRFACSLSPSKTEGAGKTGCALHPRSRVHLRTKNAHTSIQVQRRHSGLPCAMALRLIPCSPRRTASFATVAARIWRNPTRWSDSSTQLDASTAASGPHDFAVRVNAARLAHASRPPHPTATFVHDRAPPLICRETRGLMPLICPTARARICPSGCFVAGDLDGSHLVEFARAVRVVRAPVLRPVEVKVTRSTLADLPDGQFRSSSLRTRSQGRRCTTCRCATAFVSPAAVASAG